MNISNIKIKKGFALIEVLCSMAIFTILFNSALCMQLNTYSIKKYNEKVRNYTYEMRYIKDSIIYSMSYKDIVELYDSGRKYVELKNISDYDYVGIDPKKLFSENNYGREYIEMEVEKGEVLKVNLKLKADIYGIEKLEECEFYKGNFKR